MRKIKFTDNLAALCDSKKLYFYYEGSYYPVCNIKSIAQYIEISYKHKGHVLKAKTLYDLYQVLFVDDGLFIENPLIKQIEDEYKKMAASLHLPKVKFDGVWNSFNPNKQNKMKKIKLEEGMTARVENGYVVIVEPEKVEFKPKDGDFCAMDESDDIYRSLFISNGLKTAAGGFGYHAGFVFGELSLKPSTGYGLGIVRQMTDDECNEILSALAREGKRWDAEKMQIVDLEWVPKRGEVVKTDGGRMYIYESPAHNSWHNIFGGLYSDGGEIKHMTGFAESVNPTTREERTRFFSSLTEAGYKWNAKKLKLTKVEKWEPKRGEFIVAKDGSISILGKKEPSGNSNVLCRLFKNGILIPYPHGVHTPGFITRKATDSERQLLLDALKKAGKTWNTEKKCVEDIKPKYEAGNIVTCADASIVILGAEICGGYHRSLADLSHDGKLNIHPAGSASVTGDFIRGLCAASNADRMHKALKEHGKVWNAEKKQIENLAVEMTMEQVCEKLGMNVKIVKK